MSTPFYQPISGKLIVKNKRPDGDSIRFVADDISSYQKLYKNYLIKPSKDNSVQLRLEGIDSPELHYGSAAQPLGIESRDKFLGLAGFREIKYKKNLVLASTPQTVPAMILSQSADVNGRPIAYVIKSPNKDWINNQKWLELDEEMLKQTLNYQMLKSGLAYYISYTSQYFQHRKIMRQAAKEAKTRNLGVWELDTASEFKLENQESIGQNGQLIFPKLFRRSVDYLKSVDKGFEGNLSDWLNFMNTQKSRNENDQVLVSGSVQIPLSDLICQRNNKVSFQADLLDIIFVEK